MRMLPDFDRYENKGFVLLVKREHEAGGVSVPVVEEECYRKDALMAGNLKEFLQEEVNEILRSVAVDWNSDPDEFRREALSWIEKNAANFRARWDEKNA